MDVTWQQLLVVGAAVLFTAFLLWKYKPRLPRARRRPREENRLPARDAASVAKAVEAARERARAAKSARERAEALTEAGRAASVSSETANSAIGFYLRAMRADPTLLDPVRGIAELLRKERPELLESVLWRRLANLSWSGETAEAVRCAGEELVALYRKELRNRDRAKAMGKVVGRI
jgi:hypothetical protein